MVVDFGGATRRRVGISIQARSKLALIKNWHIWKIDRAMNEGKEKKRPWPKKGEGTQLGEGKTEE